MFGDHDRAILDTRGKTAGVVLSGVQHCVAALVGWGFAIVMRRALQASVAASSLVTIVCSTPSGSVVSPP